MAAGDVVSYTYGWRKSELLSRRVRHADLLERSLHLDPGETKNGKARLVEMTGKVLELLTQCCAGKAADDFLFTRERDLLGRRIRTGGTDCRLSQSVDRRHESRGSTRTALSRFATLRGRRHGARWSEREAGYD